MNYLFIAYIFTFLFALSQAANSTPNGRRGVARIMDMSAFSEYSSESNVLDKRDRVTWLVCLASIILDSENLINRIMQVFGPRS